MPKESVTLLPSLREQQSVGTLYYLELRGRGEPPHMVAAYLGLHLKNASIPFSETLWIRENSPNGQCPFLQLPDGSKMAETGKICKYLASLPSPCGRSLVVDGFQDEIFEISNAPPISWTRESNLGCQWLLCMTPWEEAGKQLPEYLTRVLPVLKQLEERLQRRGGSFFGGDTPGYGDIGLFAVIDIIMTLSPDILANVGPCVSTWAATCAELPGIKEYMAARPQVGTGEFGQSGTAMADGFTDGFRCEDTISLLLGVTSPSPNELDALSDTRTEMDLALDIAAEFVDEQLGRQHLRPTPRVDYGKSSEFSKPSSRKQRPGRLEGVVPGVDIPSSKNLGAFGLPTSLFEYLAALESAVVTGEALAGRFPELPASLGGYQRPLDNPPQKKHNPRSKARIERNAISDIAVEVANEQLSGQENSNVLDIPRPRSQSQRPGRLEDSVASVDNPCKKKCATLLPPASHSGDAAELAVFKHLEALEFAVQNGEALAGRLPELPTNLKSPRGQSQPAPTCGSSALRAVGGGLLAKAPLGLSNSGPRYFFSEDCYGMQPPLMPGARKHTSANPTAFGHSALRGTPLHQSHHVPHASALWVNTEKARLYSEESKSYGRSPAIAFLQNDGPRALESLQLELCN